MRRRRRRPPPARPRSRPCGARSERAAAGGAGRRPRRGAGGAGPGERAVSARPREGRLVVLGVTGSIAAYKAAELVRALVAAGAEGPPAMTPSAAGFLGPPPLEPERRGAALEGRRIVVSAGGTAEPIDPVRFIGNRSSGRMGAAVAEAALDRGAVVVLVAGTVSVPLPERAEVRHAETAAAMREVVLAALADADALVMAAAVADFRPQRAAEEKLTRRAGLTLELEPTEDILAEAAALAHERLRPRPVLVGFAAETGSLDRAVEKAARKRVDLLVANDVAEEGSGFGGDTNRVTIVVPGSAPERWPLLSKREVADRLLDRVAALLDARDASRQTGQATRSMRATEESRA